MTVLCLASAKSSPGATTTALALASAWPSERRLTLVEADADGGDLAARMGLAVEPGMATLSAAARHELRIDTLAEHIQSASASVDVLVGNPDGEQATRELQLAADRVARVVREIEGDVLIDLGRLRPDGPTWAFVSAADRTLIVARPRLDELQHARTAVRALRRAGADHALILVGDHPYGATEVARALEVEVAGVVADDPRAAEALRGAGSRPAHLARSKLVRSAAALGTSLLTTRPPSSPSASTPTFVTMPDVGPTRGAGRGADGPWVSQASGNGRHA